MDVAPALISSGTFSFIPCFFLSKEIKISSKKCMGWLKNKIVKAYSLFPGCSKWPTTHYGDDSVVCKNLQIICKKCQKKKKKKKKKYSKLRLKPKIQHNWKTLANTEIVVTATLRISVFNHTCNLKSNMILNCIWIFECIWIFWIMQLNFENVFFLSNFVLIFL